MKVIGMLHLPADRAGAWLRRVEYNARTLCDGGVAAIMVENNFESATPAQAPNDVVEALRRSLAATMAVAQGGRVGVGVHVRWADYEATFGLCREFGLALCRVPVVNASIRTRYGDVITICAADVRAAQKRLLNGSPVTVWVDLTPKNCELLQSNFSDPDRVADLGLAGFDHVIASERRSGEGVCRSDVDAVGAACRLHDITLAVSGSLDAASIAEFKDVAHSAIVGRALYESAGHAKGNVSAGRVRRCVAAAGN